MESNRHGKKRLLVVDDELIIRILLAEVLAEAGYLVELSGDGYHALKMLQNDAHYDVSLLDVKMPKIDGITLCRKIREDSPVLKQRFLFLIGNVDDEILSFLQENNYPYLPKPCRAVLHSCRSCPYLRKTPESALWRSPWSGN